MKLDGIWTARLFGPVGWENAGVIVLEDGRVLGGSHRHYLHGSYLDSGDELWMTVRVTYYDGSQSFLDGSDGTLLVEAEGRLENGEIVARVSRPDVPGQVVTVRLTLREALPREDALHAELFALSNPAEAKPNSRADSDACFDWPKATVA